MQELTEDLKGVASVGPFQVVLFRRTIHISSLVLLVLASTAGAHGGGRVYPIPEITDDMLARIELDGLVGEWEDFGHPTMALATDFRTDYWTASPDPGDIDFRIWLGWHDATDRLYLAFISSDDVYHNTFKYRGEGSTGSPMWWFDSITLYIDGDHSGGQGSSNSTTSDEWGLIVQRTQEYSAVARTEGSPNLQEQSMQFHRNGVLPYTVFPPYGDAAGSVIGENPVISGIEMYVSPIDSWENGWDSQPEEMRFSELSAGKTIGFAIIVADRDGYDISSSEEWLLDAVPQNEEVGTSVRLTSRWADDFADGLLMSAGESSAVEFDSWGKIKASLRAP